MSRLSPRAMSSRISSLLALLALALAGCESPPVVLPPMMFDEAFVLVDSLELEQSPDLPIVGIVSLDISEEGKIVIADPRGTRVSLFSPSGELLQTIGRRGRGPGEFMYPLSARFDEQGAVHVVDLSRRLISIFTPSGEHQRDISLPTGLLPSDMELPGNGHYWVTGQIPGGRENVLFKLDSLGGITAEYMPLASARPRGEPNHQDWMSIRMTSITLAERGPFVSFSLLDSVWAIDEMSGEIRSRAIPPEGYVAPTLPPQPIRGGPAMTAWAEASQRATGIWGDGSFLVVPFSTGFYHQAERSAASFRDANGAWHTLLDAPVLLRSRGSRLLAFARPLDERAVINVFELR